MNLDLEEEQLLLRQTFRSLLTRDGTTKAARAAEPLGFDRRLWEQLAGIEAPGIGVTAGVGGGGADLVDLCVVAEELGATIAPVPLVEHLVALRLLERAGQGGAELASAVAGDTIVTLLLHPWTGPQLVPAGAVAGSVVVHAEHALLLASPPEQAALVPNLGGLPLSEFSGPADGTVLAEGPDARRWHQQAVDEWRVLTAMALVGVAESALSIGTDYVRTRRQFGAPIGSFQAVAHGLAEMRGPINGARLLAYKAAWAAEHGDERSRQLAPMALVFAAETAQETAYRSMHYHGGYGVMEEYDIQLYFRRARGWPQVLDDSGRELRRLADAIFGAPAEQN